MLFLFLMDILQCWYRCVIWPVMGSFYTYILLLIWTGLMALTAYLFCAFSAKLYRLQCLYQIMALAIFKSAIVALFCATVTIALYDTVLYFCAQSHFFTMYKYTIMNYAMHMPWQSALSQIAEQRILTILFLIYGNLSLLYFVVPCSYQLQDDKTAKEYANYIYLASGICYLLCLSLGYV